MGKVEGLTIRKARPGDTNRIAQITAGDPDEEDIGVAGSVDLAREFGMALVRLPHSPIGWEHTTIAELDGRVVGIIRAGGGRTDFMLTPRMTYLALRTFGPIGVARLTPRIRAQRRTHPKPPSGSYHIAQMDVDPAYRSRGIGSAMLDFSEEEARKDGFQLMSLTTSTANPARHLYERHGFRVVETKTDRDFERYTGIAGRHLMVKELE